MLRAGRLIFVRHGESVWNLTDKSLGRKTRFTGWADIPLTDTGKAQAKAAGNALNELNIKFDAIFTSVLKRSVDTAFCLVDQMSKQQSVYVKSCWRLNERHYGALIGLSKDEAAEHIGRDHVMEWKSWHVKPPPMDPEGGPIASIEELGHIFGTSEEGSPEDTVDDDNRGFLFDWQRDILLEPRVVTRHPKPQNEGGFLDGLQEPEISIEDGVDIPLSESLQQTANRVLPLWQNDILPRLVKGETVLVVAHSNTIKSMVKHIDAIPPARITDISIPSAIPLIYSFALTQNEIADNLVTLGEAGGRSADLSGRFIVTPTLQNLTRSSKLPPPYLSKSVNNWHIYQNILEPVNTSNHASAWLQRDR